jgi:Flp pilus assembly pilin Flp
MSVARHAKHVERASRQPGPRGAVMVEYAFLLTTVSVMFVLGITAAGKALLSQYQEGRAVLMLPVP